jgi:hypothetical protein
MKPAQRAISATLATSLLFLTLGCASSDVTPEANLDVLPGVSLDDLNPDLVRQIAFEEVKQFLIASEPGPDNIKHVIDKGVNEEFVQKAIDQIPKMAGFFQDLVPVEKYTMIWTTKDGGTNLENLLCYEAGYCDAKGAAKFCNLGPIEYFTVFCEIDSKELNLYLFPIWQGYVRAQEYSISSFRTQPGWFSDGLASYFEGHFSGLYFDDIEYTSFGTSLSYFRGLLYENDKIVKFEEPATEKNVIDALIATTDSTGLYDPRQQAQLGPYLGLLAVEALIAAEGYETFKSFWRSTANRDFEKAFEKVYGLTDREFFEKLAPYAVEMMKRDAELT